MTGGPGAGARDRDLAALARACQTLAGAGGAAVDGARLAALRAEAARADIDIGE